MILIMSDLEIGKGWEEVKAQLENEHPVRYTGCVDAVHVKDMLENDRSQVFHIDVSPVFLQDNLLKVYTPQIIVNDLARFEDDESERDARAFFVNRVQLVGYTKHDAVESLIEEVFNEDSYWVGLLKDLLEKEDYDSLDMLYFGSIQALVEAAHTQRFELAEGVGSIYDDNESLFVESGFWLTAWKLDSGFDSNKLQVVLGNLKSANLAPEVRVELLNYFLGLVLDGVLTEGVESLIREGCVPSSNVPWNWRKWRELLLGYIDELGEDLDWSNFEGRIIPVFSEMIRDLGDTFNPRPRIALILLLRDFGLDVEDRKKIYDELIQETDSSFFYEGGIFKTVFYEFITDLTEVIPSELEALESLDD